MQDVTVQYDEHLNRYLLFTDGIYGDPSDEFYDVRAEAVYRDGVINASFVIVTAYPGGVLMPAEAIEGLLPDLQVLFGGATTPTRLQAARDEVIAEYEWEIERLEERIVKHGEAIERIRSQK